MALLVNVDNIEEAAATIDRVFARSPQFVVDTVSERLRFRVVLKVETVNPVRSFKGRGGDYVARTADRRDVLACASAGNLGQGLAYGARTHGLSTRVFAARNANPAKLARIGQLGAQLQLVDGDFDAAKVAAAREARRRGWRLIEDGREPGLAEGAATMAVELTEQYGQQLDFVIVPVGNGSLACGVAAWMKAVSPASKVIAVGTTASPAMERAWRTGLLADGGPITTIAEGLAARVPVPEAVAIMRHSVDEYVLVEEADLLSAMRLLWDECGVVSEPAGAVALAAAVAMRDRLAGATVAVPVSGANVAADLFASVVTAPPASVAP